MQEELDVKIFISGHKPCFEVKNEIFVPARQKEIIAALEQGTEEDRFMAARANEYCELLTQYWAWKYVQADYYGFGHYRRYFDFSDEKLRSRRPALQEKYLHARTAAAHGLYDVARIRRMLSRCDVLASVPFNYYIKSVRWQYENSGTLHVADLDAVTEIIRTDYPAYYAAAKKYLGGHYMYTCNMFVMKREVFSAYSEWLFGILRKFYERRDMRALGYSREAMRTPGHLGERLFGIYLTWLGMRKKYRIGRRGIVTFGDTEPSLSDTEALCGPRPLVMSVSYQTVPQAAAALYSLAHTAKEKYSVLVLAEDVPAKDRAKLRQAGEGLPMQFADVGRIADEFSSGVRDARARTAQALFALPHLCPKAERVVYMGSFCIALKDLGDLWKMPAGECIVAAADVFAEGAKSGYSKRLSALYAGLCGKNRVISTGVMVMDFAAMRKAYSLDKLFTAPVCAGENALLFLANALCGGGSASLGAVWNYQPEETDSDRYYAITQAPAPLFADWQAAGRTAAIYDFSGGEKPWQDVWSAHAQVFWRVARQTPFAEGLLLQEKKPRRRMVEGGNVVFAWIFCKLFPRGSRRRNALKKLFGKRR